MLTRRANSPWRARTKLAGPLHLTQRRQHLNTSLFRVSLEGGRNQAMVLFPPTKKQSSLPPKSPFLAPRRASDHDFESPTVGDIDPEQYTTVEPEHKSNLIGCTANLITDIVGAGIIGIPYALRETGLCAGWLLIMLSAALGIKSLRLLVATAKHVDAPSYETLSEAAFGKWGWGLCNINMFMMSWGPMLSYMMIVKDTMGRVLGYSEEDVAEQKMVLIISSLLFMLPLSLQRVRLPILYESKRLSENGFCHSH